MSILHVIMTHNCVKSFLPKVNIYVPFSTVCLNSLQETHIMHDFNRDLYGCLLKVCIIGYLRPETNFDSLEALIAAIQKDITDANEFLDRPENVKLNSHQFFKSDDENVTTNGHSNGYKKLEVNGTSSESVPQNGSSH